MTFRLADFLGESVLCYHDDDDDAIFLFCWLDLPKASSKKRDAKEPMLLFKPHGKKNRRMSPPSLDPLSYLFDGGSVPHAAVLCDT